MEGSHRMGSRHTSALWDTRNNSQCMVRVRHRATEATHSSRGMARARTVEVDMGRRMEVGTVKCSHSEGKGVWAPAVERLWVWAVVCLAVCCWERQWKAAMTGAGKALHSSQSGSDTDDLLVTAATAAEMEVSFF